jgi:hypothetical protein
LPLVSSNVLGGSSGYAIRLSTPKSQLNKNRDRDLSDCEREAAFAGAGDKRQVFDNCMKARGYYINRSPRHSREIARRRPIVDPNPPRPSPKPPFLTISRGPVDLPLCRESLRILPRLIRPKATPRGATSSFSFCLQVNL